MSLSWQDQAAKAIKHHARGTTVKVLRRSDPSLAAVEVPAVFTALTFEERASLPGGTHKLLIAAKDLGSMPLDGASVIELAGGRQYSFEPATADGAVTPAAIPGDNTALITGYIRSGGAT